MDTSQNQSVFHSFSKKSGKNPMVAILLCVCMIALGVGAGFFMSKTVHQTTVMQPAGGQAGISKGTIYGSNDTATFKDSAQGVVQKGGINGEGQFHLVRPGGDSQNVYMTSSNVDLSQFVGKKVKVNGATQTAKSAGWLMDVGRVEVVQ